MRAIWKGAISFGLINVPVRLFSATQEHDLRSHQVHRTDGGRIRMHRTCSVCGEEVAYDQLAKGYESSDGHLVVLDDDDLARLSPASGKEIDVVEFVPAGQVDPILFNRAYFLEPEARAVKAYALLRKTLAATERMAVVTVALRQRESLAVLRVRDRVIVLQTLLRPDEIRSARFDVLDQEVELRRQELTMAESLVGSLAADFRPERFEDRYTRALTALVEARLAGTAPAPGTGTPPAGTDFGDLLTALQASVERARAARDTHAARDARDTQDGSPQDGGPAGTPDEGSTGPGRSTRRAGSTRTASPPEPKAGRRATSTPRAPGSPGHRAPSKATATAKRTRTTKATKTTDEKPSTGKNATGKSATGKTPAVDKAPAADPAAKTTRKTTTSRRRSA